MERAPTTPDDRQRRQRFRMSTWAKKNLAPYWGLWLVALATLTAFAVVIIWFAV